MAANCQDYNYSITHKRQLGQIMNTTYFSKAPMTVPAVLKRKVGDGKY